MSQTDKYYSSVQLAKEQLPLLLLEVNQCHFSIISVNMSVFNEKLDHALYYFCLDEMVQCLHICLCVCVLVFVSMFVRRRCRPDV